MLVIMIGVVDLEEQLMDMKANLDRLLKESVEKDTQIKR